VEKLARDSISQYVNKTQKQTLVQPGRQETWGDSPEGYPQTAPYKWWNWHDNYDAEAASPNPKWIDITTDPQEAARKRAAEAKA
jgi:hypothetical protein